jgi:toxin-antitoxin system PIN domain toxin
MIAVDTNILVHAHRAESPWHEAAAAGLRELAQEPWALPWPCIHEFMAIVTHPKIFDPPSPLADARRAADLWLAAPTVKLLSEAEGYWETLSGLLKTSGVVGPRIHDARIAALCIQHGVDEIWTADRDFSRFPGIKTRNPLLPTT